VLLQCAVRAMLGTNVRPPEGRPGPLSMVLLLMWYLSVCRNAFGAPAHSSSPSIAFWLRSWFAFGMFAFHFGWCARPRPKPLAYMCSGRRVFFLVRVPSSPWHRTSADALPHTHGVHWIVSRCYASSQLEAPPCFIAQSVQSVQCRLQRASCACGCSHLPRSGCDRVCRSLLPCRPPPPRYAPCNMSTVHRADSEIWCAIPSTPTYCVPVSFDLEFAHAFCVCRLFG
jgi:hypothetical protein